MINKKERIKEVSDCAKKARQFYFEIDGVSATKNKEEAALIFAVKTSIKTLLNHWDKMIREDFYINL